MHFLCLNIEYNTYTVYIPAFLKCKYLVLHIVLIFRIGKGKSFPRAIFGKAEHHISARYNGDFVISNNHLLATKVEITPYIEDLARKL